MVIFVSFYIIRFINYNNNNKEILKKIMFEKLLKSLKLAAFYMETEFKVTRLIERLDKQRLKAKIVSCSKLQVVYAPQRDALEAKVTELKKALEAKQKELNDLKLSIMTILESI